MDTEKIAKCSAEVYKHVVNERFKDLANFKLVRVVSPKFFSTKCVSPKFFSPKCVSPKLFFFKIALVQN